MPMNPSNPTIALAVLVAAVLGLAGCGSGSEPTEASAAATDAADDAEGAGEDATDPDEDEDHGDEDHGDEDEDHGDEDHDEDEDHDDDHDEDKDHDDDHDEDDDHDDDHEDHDDESSSGLGAHEHGVADISVAWSDGEMVIDLISPTQNIFGFEYEAESDEDIALVADRLEALSDPGILVINEEAGCSLTDEVATELEYEGSHAELTATWLLSCESPEEIKQLDASALFTEFPGFEDIDAQWASAGGQSAAELSPSATILALE